MRKMALLFGFIVLASLPFGCGKETGALLVRWQRKDVGGNPIACGANDKVRVSIGDVTQDFACNLGGSGTDAQGNAYVGMGTISDVTAGGPYNVFVEVIDGVTGYVGAQVVISAAGYIRSDVPLDAGTVTLQDATVSGPESGVPDGGLEGGSGFQFAGDGSAAPFDAAGD